jgi:uncharacterized membrane protein
MKKATQNYILAVLLFLTSFTVTFSGFVLWLAFPHIGGGSRGTSIYRTFWGVTNDTWTAIHDWVGVAIIVVAILHIILHWNWIVRMTKRYFRPAVQTSA